MSSLIEIKLTPTEESQEPVTLAEAKAYCRIDFNDDDTIIPRLITSTRERLEKYCSRVFRPAECKAVYTQQGCGDRIILAYSDNIELTGDSTQYVDGMVSESYINTTDKVVLLEYTAGYEQYPDWIKQAVLMDVAYRYENRGDIGANPDHISSEVKSFVAPFVNWSLL